MRWHFECPDCGYDDKEAKVLAKDDQIWCGLCASDSGHARRLVRWPEGTKKPEIRSFGPGYDVGS